MFAPEPDDLSPESKSIRIRDGPALAAPVDALIPGSWSIPSPTSSRSIRCPRSRWSLKCFRSTETRICSLPARPATNSQSSSSLVPPELCDAEVEPAGVTEVGLVFADVFDALCVLAVPPLTLG